MSWPGALGRALTTIRTDQLRTQINSSGADRALARVEPMPSTAKASTTTGVVTAVNTSVLCHGSAKR